MTLAKTSIVDGTRSLALGPKFLCHPRGRKEGEGQMAQEVWPLGQSSSATQEGAGEDLMNLWRPVWLIVKSALSYNNVYYMV